MWYCVFELTSPVSLNTVLCPTERLDLRDPADASYLGAKIRVGEDALYEVRS